MTRDEILKQFNIPLPDEGALKAIEILRKRSLPTDFSATMKAVDKFKQQLGIVDKNMLRDIIESHKRIITMLNTPQFKRLQNLENLTRSWVQESLPTYTPEALSEDSELCADIDALIEKAETQGIEEDALPDERTMQDVFFIVAFYATILAPEAINDWVAHIYESLKIQIHDAVNASGGVFVSGIFNIKTMLEIAFYLWLVLRQLK